MNMEVKPIEIRKPWRRTIKREQKPLTYFASYHSRLYALAHRHGIPPAAFKGLIEDAFGKCDTPPAEQEARLALMKLAKLKVGPCEINWLFQYCIMDASEIATNVIVLDLPPVPGPDEAA